MTKAVLDSDGYIEAQREIDAGWRRADRWLALAFAASLAGMTLPWVIYVALEMLVP